MHSFNPSTRGQRQVDLCEIKACQVYRVNSCTAKAMQKETLSQKIETNKKRCEDMAAVIPSRHMDAECLLVTKEGLQGWGCMGLFCPMSKFNAGR